MVVNKKRLLHHRKKVQYQKHYQEIQQQKEQKLLNHGCEQLSTEVLSFVSDYENF